MEKIIFSKLDAREILQANTQIYAVADAVLAASGYPPHYASSCDNRFVDEYEKIACKRLTNPAIKRNMRDWLFHRVDEKGKRLAREIAESAEWLARAYIIASISTKVQWHIMKEGREVRFAIREPRFTESGKKEVVVIGKAYSADINDITSEEYEEVESYITTDAKDVERTFAKEGVDFSWIDVKTLDALIKAKELVANSKYHELNECIRLIAVKEQ